MHMADALISPVTGGVMWATTAGLISYCSTKITGLDDGKTSLMGVLGAFIFAAQMINFTIPGTGSSGHLGGGMILAILLGPHAAFLTMASVLTVQALLFADGGLLALGCNIFNLGFFPCFIVYPFIYKKITADSRSQGKILAGSLIAGIIGLQMGAFSVVLETVFSGISDLPFKSFVIMMLPIHLAIGVVEGLVTAAVVSFVFQARPELLNDTRQSVRDGGSVSMKRTLIGFLALAVITGGILSWFASQNPDGLEWSMAKVTGSEELKKQEDSIHKFLSLIQEKTAFLPEYGFKDSRKTPEGTDTEDKQPSKSSVDVGTSVSGIVGGMLTLVIAMLIGFCLKRRNMS